MQLYTKTGDKGLTKLVGGQSVCKVIQIESHTGLLMN